MIENLPVKIDEAGRIVVPTKIRKKYNIQKNDLLILKTNENSFQLIKDDQEKKLKELLTKIKNIENLYKLNILLADNEKIFYASSVYENLINKEISENLKKIITTEVTTNNERIMQLKEPYIKDSCYYSVIKLNSYTKILFIITYKNKKEEKLASLITKLVTSN